MIEEILRFVAKATKMLLEVDIVTPGSPWGVKFEVKARPAPTADVAQSQRQVDLVRALYSGIPDFAILRKLQRRTPRLNLPRAIGETQSRTKASSVMGSVAQAGIYSFGYLAKTKQKRVVTVVLTKKKQGLVLVATRELSTCNYRFVHTNDPMELGNAQELQKFCQLLVAALRVV